jgi:hypothetical protein
MENLKTVTNWNLGSFSYSILKPPLTCISMAIEPQTAGMDFGSRVRVFAICLSSAARSTATMLREEPPFGVQVFYLS